MSFDKHCKETEDFSGDKERATLRLMRIFQSSATRKTF